MYINTATKEYPLSRAQIKAKFPNTSFPDAFVPPAPYALVHMTALPEYDADTHTVKEAAPVLINGRWEQTWALIERSEEEKQAIQQRKYKNATQGIRGKRNMLLAQSDWTQVADAPVDKATWAAYRQALRDVPAQAGFPHDVTWPEQP
jgi:hypothetical protein